MLTVSAAGWGVAALAVQQLTAAGTTGACPSISARLQLHLLLKQTQNIPAQCAESSTQEGEGRGTTQSTDKKSRMRG